MRPGPLSPSTPPPAHTTTPSQSQPWCAAVVHLAAKLGGELSEIDSIVSANVIGTYNIMEAARRCNLRRVVFASAGAVSMNREHEEPFLTLTNPHVPPPEAWEKITHLDEPRPHGLYGAAPSPLPGGFWVLWSLCCCSWGSRANHQPCV